MEIKESQNQEEVIKEENKEKEINDIEEKKFINEDNIIEKEENIIQNNNSKNYINNIINNQSENENQNGNIINEEKINENEIKINIDEKNNNKIILNSEKKEEKSKDIKSNIIFLDKNSEKLSNIPIYIYSAKTIEINNIPILIYFIKGKLVYKDILRTSNDFELFHQTLIEMWPCISIPGIFFKHSTTNANESIRFPEIKTKLLNHFFKKLSESQELLNCEATKIFLSQDQNFGMKLTNMNTNSNYKEISERYFRVFTDFVEDKKIIEEKEFFIKRFIKLIELTYKKLAEIGKTIENEIYNIKNEKNYLDFVTTMILDLEKSIPNTKKKMADMTKVIKPLKTVSIKLIFYFRIIILNHILYFTHII